LEEEELGDEKAIEKSRFPQENNIEEIREINVSGNWKHGYSMTQLQRDMDKLSLSPAEKLKLSIDFHHKQETRRIKQQHLDLARQRHTVRTKHERKKRKAEHRKSVVMEETKEIEAEKLEEMKKGTEMKRKGIEEERSRRDAITFTVCFVHTKLLFLIHLERIDELFYIFSLWIVLRVGIIPCIFCELCTYCRKSIRVVEIFPS